MKCPKCQVDLVISDRQGIEIDFCPQCRGVWLDRGELDKIIERGARYVDTDDDRRPSYDEGARRPPYDQGRRPEYRDDYHYKKRKSFWTEIFD